MGESNQARKAAARAADRRRSAVSALNIGEATCRYASSQLANGLGPAEARDLALEMAGELAAVAQVLRKAAWLSTADRRRLAAQLRGLGLPTKQIADRLGVSDRSVRVYLRQQRPGKPAHLENAGTAPGPPAGH